MKYFRASRFWRQKFLFSQNNRLVMISSKTYDRKRMNAPNGSMISISNLKPCLSLSFYIAFHEFLCHSLCYVLLEVFQSGGWCTHDDYLAPAYPALSIRRVLPRTGLESCGPSVMRIKPVFPEIGCCYGDAGYCRRNHRPDPASAGRWAWLGDGKHHWARGIVVYSCFTIMRT